MVGMSFVGSTMVGMVGMSFVGSTMVGMVGMSFVLRLFPFSGS
jgi:hypothetical protein